MGDKQAGNAMRRHLLVTNDYPPKVGGIQSYLWELWRRLPAEDVAVHTTPYNGTERFDAQQDYTLTRSKEPVLLPHPWVARRVANWPPSTKQK
jgi:phosphatidyl-myo-inositol dimannoside synthase